MRVEEPAAAAQESTEENTVSCLSPRSKAIQELLSEIEPYEKITNKRAKKRRAASFDWTPEEVRNDCSCCGSRLRSSQRGTVCGIQDPMYFTDHHSLHPITSRPSTTSNGR